jgi:ABC-type lipoprotein export system ATPase subunit
MKKLTVKLVTAYSKSFGQRAQTAKLFNYVPWIRVSNLLRRVRLQSGNQLSVGQKCTALLLIALSEGTMPIIVDQPEDALDVATVYYDVVSRLRGRKEQRQFILTTHNPNIAVSSDTDKYHVLKATEDTGQIVCCGAHRP